MTLLCVAGCGAGLPHPDAAQLSRVREHWPDATAAQLAEGRSRYVARCSGCHSLHRPSEYEAGQWEGILERMAPRARLTPAETESIRRYLATAAVPR